MTEQKNTLVFSDTPDRIDYAKLTAAHHLARETGTSVVVHDVCLECPAITTVPPTPPGQLGHVAFEHEDWCPVLALHEGRELTPAQQRKHRRHMDTGR